MSLILAPIARTSQALTLEKLLEGDVTIREEATPKARTKLIHCCDKRPGFEVEQLVQQVVGVLDLSQLLLDIDSVG